MRNTYLTFYKPKNILKASWTLKGNYLCQWLQQGKKPRYLHVGVKVGDDLVTAEYYSLCWDGLDFHRQKDIEDKYEVVQVPFYFDEDYLGYTASNFVRTGYKILIMDLLKALFRKRTCQYLCTGFVCDVIDRTPWIGTLDGVPGFRPLSPDQLYTLAMEEV